MNTISNISNLSIILPNTNKALAQVIQNSTKEELTQFTQTKDLKSLLNSLFKQTNQTDSTKENILQLVKNNPTLKNLETVSSSLKNLQNALQPDFKNTPITLKLNNFLTNIKELTQDNFKQKIQNSGLLLESSIKNATNPQEEFKNTLLSLLKNTKELPTSKNKIQVLENLKSLLTPTTLEKLKSDTPLALKNIATQVKELIDKSLTFAPKQDSLQEPSLIKNTQKLEHLTQKQMLLPHNFKLPSIIKSLESLQIPLQNTLQREAQPLLISLEKILNTLKAPQVKILQTETLNTIKTFTLDIKNTINHLDSTIESKNTSLLKKLEPFTNPINLHSQNQIKEIISNDFKALLLQASDEVIKSNHPNQTEILKNIDKLTLQIDYHQLLSHLSNNTSLYLPFSWDMMEEGTISIEKSEEDKFYCDIHLKLKEYGDIDLKLTIYEKNQLNLHIYASSQAFRELIKENISSLRSALIDTQITPREIRIFDEKNIKNTTPYQTSSQEFKMGFEVKV